MESSRDTRCTVCVNNRDEIKVQEALRACEFLKCFPEVDKDEVEEDELPTFMDLRRV